MGALRMWAKDITPGSNHSDVTRFSGFSIYEDASTAALIIFRKASVSGQILAMVPLAADEGATIQFDIPLSAEGGVYVQESSGSITGVLYASN